MRQENSIPRTGGVLGSAELGAEEIEFFGAEPCVFSAEIR
jgi:hypothetical protein